MILPIYAVGVAGAFLQITGAQWDVSAHILGIVETFFTPAHTVLYTGIALVALAIIWAQLNFFSYWTTDVTGMAYTFGYCSIQQFRASVPCPFVQQFSTVSFLIAAGIFAASGTLVFWTSKSLFHRTGVITSIAVILAATYSAAALGFSAYALRFLNPPGSWYINNAVPDEGTRLALFIPLYLLSLIPILVLDMSTKNSIGRNRLLGLSALVGPFAALIDGRYALGLAESAVGALAFVVVPMILGGIVGWVLLTRLARGLIPNLTIPDTRSIAGEHISGKRPIRQS